MTIATTTSSDTNKPDQGLGVWHNPTADYSFGLGPWGSITAVIALFACFVAFIPPDNKIRNVAITAVVSMLVVGPFAWRDRWGRNLYQRIMSRLRWTWHRATGANLFEASWFSTTPVTKSRLPGLLSQLSIAEHQIDDVTYAVVHHPPADTVGVVIDCSPVGGDLVDEHVLVRRKKAWVHWLDAMADEPGLASVQVVTETAPALATVDHDTVKMSTDGSLPVADAILDELVEAVARRPTTRTWVTVNWTTEGRRARSIYTADVLAPRVERLCAELSHAGAGTCTPVTTDQLARLWAGMYDPDRRESLAAQPDEPLDISNVGPTVAHEHRDRYSIGGHDTVSMTVGVAPGNHITGTVYRRLAKGIDGTVAVRWAQHYRPVDAIEARSWAKTIQRSIETRFALAGERKPNVEDVVADEDTTATAAALARGASLTRIGFTATLTLPAGYSGLAGPIERTRTAIAPLSAHLRVMNGAHQTSFVATLPGAMPIPETLKATEGLNQ